MMNTLPGIKEVMIKGLSRDSRIIIGGSLDGIAKYIPNSNVIIITDERVYELYSSRFPAFPVIRIKSGEEYKNLGTIEFIYKQLLVLKADRFTYVLGIGGGVVCDICGFAASTFLRGLRYGFVATTLLAQVDASIGGKNGVNFNGLKNIIGVFNQPEFVLCDHSLLKTLDEHEFFSGLGEVLKYAFIRDPEILDYFKLERFIDKPDLKLIHELVVRSVNIKKSIVEKDELETGERRLLNFGHTFGHAIESAHGLSHGIAVSYGMMAAIYISEREGYLALGESNNARDIILKSGILKGVKINLEKLQTQFKADKKRSGNYLYFILLRSIGNAFAEKVEIGKVGNWLVDWLNWEKTFTKEID